MKSHYWKLVVALLLVAPMCGGTARAQKEPDNHPAEGIRRGIYREWPESLMIDAHDSHVKAILTPKVGGRLFHYSASGLNIIWESGQTDGKTLQDIGKDFEPGGFQTFIEMVKTGETGGAVLSVGEYAAEVPAPWSAKLSSEADAVTGLKLHRDLVMNPANGNLGWNIAVENAGREIRTVALAHRARLMPKGYVVLPVDKVSRYPGRWAVERMVEGKLEFDGYKPQLPGVELKGDYLIIDTSKGSGRVATDSNQGWVAYIQGRLMLVRYFPRVPWDRYSEFGSTVQASWTQTATDLVVKSPILELKPGTRHASPELWILERLEETVDTHSRARSAVKDAQESPFAPK